MDKILVVDSSLISVWVYPERGMIHHVMKTYCHGDDFREALTRGVEAMELHQATKWLSDNRANGALPPEDAAWSAKNWFPRAKAAGWKHWSIVQPVKIIGQVNMARLVKQYGDLGINAQMFSDPDEAMAWLEGQR
jgi:hypothetical protein